MENDTVSSPDDTSSIDLIIFILLIIVEIPALICTSLILIFFFFQWYLMMIKSLGNHAVFLLIVVSFFYITLDLPFTISLYHLGYDYFRTPSFCLWWYWFDYTLLATSLSITMTTSIQRHILILNSYLLHMKRTRWLLHYIPLIVCTLYPSIFYIVFIFIYPCETFYDEESLLCIYPCYSDNIVLNNIDWGTNYIFPVFMIVIANLTLVCRVIYSMKKVRHRHARTWKRQRKLTLQLLSFSLLYIFGWGPTTLISLIQMFWLPNLYEDNPKLYYINNSSCFICPLQSFICIFSLPELMKYIKRRIRQRRIVVPGTAFI